jgi:hypothetical protein
VERIRYAVKKAFSDDPKEIALREKVAAENASVWVLNGTGTDGQAADVAGYLSWSGMRASAPNQKPEEVPATTTVRVFNGAEARLKQTLAYLTKTFGVTPEPVTDPAVRVDLIVVTASDTPKLAPPNAP